MNKLGNPIRNLVQLRDKIWDDLKAHETMLENWVSYFDAHRNDDDLGITGCRLVGRDYWVYRVGLGIIPVVLEGASHFDPVANNYHYTRYLLVYYSNTYSSQTKAESLAELRAMMMGERSQLAFIAYTHITDEHGGSPVWKVSTHVDNDLNEMTHSLRYINPGTWTYYVDNWIGARLTAGQVADEIRQGCLFEELLGRSGLNVNPDTLTGRFTKPGELVGGKDV